jgi:hypothetical protein
MKVLLIRLKDDGKQTIGELRVYENEKLVFSCKTLELAYRDNKKGVSCIPKGYYLVTRRNDKRSKFKYEHLHVQHVPNRRYILFHVGNFHFQIQGCVLVGSTFYDLNKDGLLDVANSRNTFQKLMEIVPDSFVLQIV